MLLKVVEWTNFKLQHPKVYLFSLQKDILIMYMDFDASNTASDLILVSEYIRKHIHQSIVGSSISVNLINNVG